MKKQFHTNLDEELIKELKVQAAKEGMRLNDFIEKLFKESLAKKTEK